MNINERVGKERGKNGKPLSDLKLPGVKFEQGY